MGSAAGGKSVIRSQFAWLLSAMVLSLTLPTTAAFARLLFQAPFLSY